MSAPRHRVFIKGGVTAALTDDVLRNFFQRFGEVVDVYIPKDPGTHDLKGFAFISFSDAEGVNEVLREAEYTIEGHTVPVTRADPRHESRGGGRAGGFSSRGLAGPASAGYRSHLGMGAGGGSLPLGAAAAATSGLSPYSVDHSGMQYLGHSTGSTSGALYGLPESTHAYGYYDSPGFSGRIRGAVSPAVGMRGGSAADREDDNRIYVGGVPEEITKEDVKEHFEKYGQVVDVYFPKDKSSGKRRNFCYVRFSTFDAADTACARSQRNIKGTDILEIRIAQPRPGDRFRYSPY